MLPSSRHFLDSLLPPLSSPSFIPPPSSPTSPLQPHQKPLFLTLHCLFPNELLPALDLLDRRLVSRLILQASISSKAPQAEVEAAVEGVGNVEQGGDEGPRRCVYYVRSSQQPRSRFSSKRNESTTTEGTSYEVRLQAWNCSCAAFAFAAFEGEWSVLSASDDEDVNEDGRDVERKGAWKMGGMTLGKGVPMCKHLLACVLAERVEGLGEFVEERTVTREEMAGWAAGWGG